MGMFAGLIWLYVLCILIIGFFNFFGSIIRRLSPINDPEYKSKLNKYLLLVLGYFVLLFIGSQSYEYLTKYFEGGIVGWIVVFYLFIVPLPLAIFYWSIIKKEYILLYRRLRNKI